MLIGAHWDTRSLSDEDPNKEKPICLFRANDGASGTAVLWSCHYIFKK